MANYQRIQIKDVKPTEFLIPADSLEQIAEYYDGNSESILAPMGYLDEQGKFMPEKGNKRITFLHLQGHDYFTGLVQDHDKEDFDACMQLVERAQGFGVSSIDNLSKKVVPRDEYDSLMSVFDKNR